MELNLPKKIEKRSNRLALDSIGFTRIKCSNAFSKCNHLKLTSIDLTNNQICEIEKEAFDKIKDLKMILIENNLTQIDSKFSDGLSSLEVLSIRKNQINKIHQNGFKHLT